jgi:hypothetical protein
MVTATDCMPFGPAKDHTPLTGVFSNKSLYLRLQHTKDDGASQEDMYVF